jgi:hypothetical protein
MREGYYIVQPMPEGKPHELVSGPHFEKPECSDDSLRVEWLSAYDINFGDDFSEHRMKQRFSGNS